MSARRASARGLAPPGTGALQLVATPIGNLEDVTLRALRVLREAELVFAEDTRRTRTLLERHAIVARPLSLHEHNERSRLERALAVLAGGGRVALVSDAGTPLLSDPGARLVEAVLEAGHRVEPVPGPSAVIAALVGSGLPSQPFAFLGFLPRRRSERDALLASWCERPETLVIFESPRRLPAALRTLRDTLGGERQACVARELTKLHEEWSRDCLAVLCERFSEAPKGEVTLVVGGAPEMEARRMTSNELDAEISARRAQGQGAREIAAELAHRSGLPRRDVYARVVALDQEATG